MKERRNGEEREGEIPVGAWDGDSNEKRGGRYIYAFGIRDVGSTKTLRLDWISRSPSFDVRLPSLARV